MEQHDRRSVLIVEDEVLVRLTIADDLRQAGFIVLEAANADEAGLILQTHADWVGVVLTDIQMPGSMDGAGLVRMVRQRYPGTRVVVLSGASPAVLKGVPADAILTKPHTPEEFLVREINQLLDHRPSNGTRNNNAGRS